MLSIRTIALTLSLICFGPALATAQRQADPLAQMCQAFLSSSGAAGPSNPGVLCTCLVTEVPAQLSLEEMQAYQRSVAAGQPLLATVQQKITSIATQCLAAAR